jgi:hypothetical protein
MLHVATAAWRASWCNVESKEREPLSQWCVARIMLRKDWTQAGVESRVGVVPRLSHTMKTWTERWRDVEASILCRHVTSKLLDEHQINGFTTQYKKSIACLVDGTVVNISTSRQRSGLQRSTWSKKSKSNAGVGLGLAGRLSPRQQQPIQRTTLGERHRVAIA